MSREVAMRLLLLVLVSVLLFPGVARAAPLTNTAHLDFLGDDVTPPAQAGHTTFGDGPLGVLWTYADRQADGTYKRIGGGPYDAATNTYGQGAFNADDIARAAVVYVRHWRSDRLARLPRAGGRAAARPDLPAVAQRQRRAVDAARRDAESQRGAGRAARPVGLRPVLLARPHGLGARRGAPRVRARRSRVRALPGRADGPARSPRSSGRSSTATAAGRSSTASASRRG